MPPKRIHYHQRTPSTTSSDSGSDDGLWLAPDGTGTYDAPAEVETVLPQEPEAPENKVVETQAPRENGGPTNTGEPVIAATAAASGETAPAPAAADTLPPATTAAPNHPIAEPIPADPARPRTDTVPPPYTSEEVKVARAYVEKGATIWKPGSQDLNKTKMFNMGGKKWQQRVAWVGDRSLCFGESRGKNVKSTKVKAIIEARVLTDEAAAEEGCPSDKVSSVFRWKNKEKSYLFACGTPAARRHWLVYLAANGAEVFFGNNNKVAGRQPSPSFISKSGVDREEFDDIDADDIDAIRASDANFRSAADFSESGEVKNKSSASTQMDPEIPLSSTFNSVNTNTTTSGAEKPTAEEEAPAQGKISEPQSETVPATETDAAVAESKDEQEQPQEQDVVSEEPVRAMETASEEQDSSSAGVQADEGAPPTSASQSTSALKLEEAACEETQPNADEGKSADPSSSKEEGAIGEERDEEVTSSTKPPAGEESPPTTNVAENKTAGDNETAGEHTSRQPSEQQDEANGDNESSQVASKKETEEVEEKEPAGGQEETQSTRSITPPLDSPHGTHLQEDVSEGGRAGDKKNQKPTEKSSLNNGTKSSTKSAGYGTVDEPKTRKSKKKTEDDAPPGKKKQGCPCAVM